MPKGKTAPTSVDEYLAGVPAPARLTLSRIRAAIRSVAPAEATESISYGMPAFRYKRSVIWYAAFSSHCSLFPGSTVLDSFEKELKAFQTLKGTIKFPAGKPPSVALIRKLAKARFSQNERKNDR